MKKDSRVKLLIKENNVVNRLTKQVNKLAVGLTKQKKKKAPAPKKKAKGPAKAQRPGGTLRAVDAMLDPTLRGKVPAALSTGDQSISLASYPFNCSAHMSTLVGDTAGNNMVLALFLGGIAGDARAVQFYTGTDINTKSATIGSSMTWRDIPLFATPSQQNQELAKINGYTASIKYSGSLLQRMGLCHLLVAHDHASASNMEAILTGWAANTKTMQGVRDDIVSSRYHKYCSFADGSTEEFVVPVKQTWSDLFTSYTLQPQYWPDSQAGGEANTIVAIAILDMGSQSAQTWPVGYSIEARISGEIHSQANRMFLTPSPPSSVASNNHVHAVSTAISQCLLKREHGTSLKAQLHGALGIGQEVAKSKTGKKVMRGAMAAALGLIL